MSRLLQGTLIVSLRTTHARINAQRFIGVESAIEGIIVLVVLLTEAWDEEL